MAHLPVTNPSNDPGFCQRNRQVYTEQSKILKSAIFGVFVKGVVQPLDTEKGITKEKSLVHRFDARSCSHAIVRPQIFMLKDCLTKIEGIFH